MIYKVGDHCLKCDGIAENGKDVEETDALLNSSLLEHQPHKRGHGRHTGLGKSWYLVTMLRKKSVSDMAEPSSDKWEVRP